MRTRNAFTLVEVLIVVVIIGILAAVTIPRFAGATEDARTSSAQSTLAGVRSSIATFRMNAVINGSDPYPTITQLTDGTTMRFDIPLNPFTGVGGVQAVSRAQADARSVVSSQSAGWNYHVDNSSNPPVAIFYVNASDDSTSSDGSGGVLGANEL